MALNIALVGLGVTVLAVSSWFARRLREAINTDTELAAVGHVLTLLVANTLQALGVVMIIAGLFGD